MPSPSAANIASTVGACWARAKPIAGAQEGRRAGGRHQRREEAGEEVAGDPLARSGAAEPRQALRQRDLEQPPEVEAEEHHHHGEEGDEAGVLELHPPAHRRAGRVRRHRHQRQRQERGEDAGRRRQRPAHHLGAAVAGAAHQAEDLEREHRQHAGHGVEDQPAEQGEQQRDARGCRRASPERSPRSRGRRSARRRRVRPPAAALAKSSSRSAAGRPGPTLSSIRASAVTGGRHCESLQAW